MTPPQIRHMAKGILSDKPEKELDEKASAGDLESLHIEPAENGFSVTHHRRPKSTKGDAPVDFQHTTKHVFNHHDQVAEHVRQVLGGKSK